MKQKKWTYIKRNKISNSNLGREFKDTKYNKNKYGNNKD